MLTVDTERPTTSAGRISKVETRTLGTTWRVSPSSGSTRTRVSPA